jgi:hypothetical protein
MADVRVYIKLKYEGMTAAFYDVSRRVNYESLNWESNSEGTSANATIDLWTILPKSSTAVQGYAGATEADKINAAIADESFVIEIPSKTEVRILDVATNPDTVLFAGYVTRVSTRKDGGAITQEVECADNTALLEELIIADFYGARDSRDIDIINGGSGASTSAASLPSIVGQVDGLQISSEAVGGSLTDGVYSVRIQARSTTLLGRDAAAPQYSQVTSAISITLSAGTTTQRLKVKWKNASLADQHRVYVIKNAGTEYLGKTTKALLSAIDITAANRASNIVTITTASSHGLSAGDPIVVTIPQTAGFSVALDDYVIATATTTNTISYASVGGDGSATITNAKLTSGSAGYVSSLVTAESPTALTSSSPRGWVDGEFYVVAGSTYRLGVGDDNIRGWQYPISIFDALFDKSLITAGTLDVKTYVNAVDTQYRFSPYLPESDTANYEQYGGRSVRNVLDYISQKTGGEFWVDKGTIDGSGNYKAYLHYGAKTPKELVVNGIYDGNIDGWTTASGFAIGSATSGPYGAGYSVSSSASNTKIETATSSRVSTVSGRKYFFSVRGKVSTHQNRWGAYIVWYNSGGTELSTTHIGNLPGSPVGTWHRVWKTATAPSTAAYFGLRGQCTGSQSGSASFTDWSAIQITGSMGYGDVEDSVTHAVPVYEMEVPSSPVESGNSANRLHLYAVFRTRDEDGNKVALTDESGNPVQYVDYDFVPGIWATNGKIIETATTNDKVETLADAQLAAKGFWKENGLPIESYEFDIRPRDAYDSVYPVPNVGDIIPFIWDTMNVAKPLIVKSVKAKMLGMDIVYSITVGGDIRLQRNSFILVSERLRELDKVNPVPPTPSAPTEISAIASIKSATVSWNFDEDIERNKNLSSFEVQRQDGIFKAITNVARALTTVTITTSGAHGIVNGDKVRVEMKESIYNQATKKIQGEWIVTGTTTTTFTYTSVESGLITSVAATGWAIYNFTEFRAIQNTKSTYINDNGLSSLVQYRYQVRAMSTDDTAGNWTDESDPVTPGEVVADSVADGSITAAKLVASLKAIEIVSAAALPTLPSSSYTAGTIVYHLGGTPPGLRRVSVAGTAWENAVGAGDIVANSITAGLISTAGIDAGVIKSGQLTIDSRFGLGVLKDVSYKQKTTTVATLTTTAAHGFVSGNTVTVSGVGSPFDGTFSVLASPAPTTFTFSYTTATGAVNLTEVNPRGAALVKTNDFAIRTTTDNFTVDYLGNVVAKSITLQGANTGSYTGAGVLGSVVLKAQSGQSGAAIIAQTSAGALGANLAIQAGSTTAGGVYFYSSSGTDEGLIVAGGIAVSSNFAYVYDAVNNPTYGPPADGELVFAYAGGITPRYAGGGNLYQSATNVLRTSGGFSVGSTLAVGSTATFTGVVDINNTTDSSSTAGSGALYVAGGMYVAKKTFQIGNFYANYIDVGTSTTDDSVLMTLPWSSGSSNTYSLRAVQTQGIVTTNEAGSTGGSYGNQLTARSVYKFISQRAYKEEIEDLLDTEDILDAQPVSYYPKGSRETLGDKAQIEYGFVVEDFAPLNKLTSKYTVRDQDGVPMTVQYELLAVPIISAMRSLRSRIAALEAKIVELEG